VLQPVFTGNDERANGAATLTQMATSGEWLRTMEGHGVLAPLVQWINQMDLAGAIGRFASWLASTSASLVRGWFWQLVTIVLTFYLLFYFLRDRKLALAWLHEYHPCPRQRRPGSSPTPTRDAQRHGGGRRRAG
jgi:predicted PurR-regulated permease PerM